MSQVTEESGFPDRRQTAARHEDEKSGACIYTAMTGVFGHAEVFYNLAASLHVQLSCTSGCGRNLSAIPGNIQYAPFTFMRANDFN
jgi:hypothetical protein